MPLLQVPKKMIPKLDIENFIVNDYVDHAVITEIGSGREVRIESTDALFLRCIDGATSVAEIRTELSELLDWEVPAEKLWAALDTLADIGVLEQRLTPPAGKQVTSRRTFLSLFGATAAASTIVAPSLAFADQTAEEQVKQSEQNAKQAAVQAEKDQKSPPSEQATKQQSEQNAKQAEQSAKQSSEQTTKQQAESQQKQQVENQTKQQAEASAKQQAEQEAKRAAAQSEKDQKSPPSEQTTKQQSEQNAKQAEQSAKQSSEQTSKQQAEASQKQSERDGKSGQEQLQKNSQEIAAKEYDLKSSSGGPTSVPEPGTIAVVGLGLATMKLIQRRVRVSAEEATAAAKNPEDNTDV